METITLKSGLELPQLGLGTWKLEGEDCVSGVEAALEMGYKHIDTAAGYGNHQEVGQGIKNSGVDRSEFWLTSKVWRTDLHHDDLLAAGKEMLAELDVGYLDLLLVHWPNQDIPLEETLTALEKLKEQGLARSVGVSNFTINHLEDVFSLKPDLVDVNQVEIHPYFYQEELIDYCQENDLAVTAYSPLARGRVFQDVVLNNLAEKYDRSPAQLVLRWLMDRGIVVIPKSSSPEHMKDNLQALEQPLSEEAEEKISKLNEGKRIIDPGFGEFDY